MNNSAWQENVQMPRFPKLCGKVTTDVLIIGGGMCGVLCARKLHELGVDYMLVESKTIGSGITKNTTAKITSQHGLIYDKMLRKDGARRAKMYLDANEKAVAKFRKMAEKIDCDFENKSAYAYSIDNNDKIEREIKALQTLGFKAERAESLPLPFYVAGAVKFENQAQFNPLKFLTGVSKGLNIFEHSHVKGTAENTAKTDDAQITAKNIIVATHFPFINKHGSYFLKMYQHRSYVIALENAPNVDGMFIDEAKCGMSFRNYNGMLLIGGGDHRTGKQGGNWAELREFAKKHYPQAREKYAWAAQDCMSLDGKPYIGNYSARTPNLFAATGFNKWGMTTSMVAAEILADLTRGKHCELAEIFSPSRSLVKPQLAINGIEATAGLLSLSTRRCPHLGCALKWNRAEHSWDCPCHGSRFEENGMLIDNPATGDAHMS